MAISKSLYEMPEGIEMLAEQEAPIEIEIEDPEAVRIGMGPLTIELEAENDSEDEFDANLAERMEESALQKVASDILEMVQADIDARKDWVEMYVKGLDELGLS